MVTAGPCQYHLSVKILFLNHRGLNLSILVWLLGHLLTEKKLASCRVQYTFWRENTCPYVNSVRRQIRQVLCLTELTYKLTELTNPPKPLNVLI